MSPNNGFMQGKICTVTGATSGIGAVTAHHLAAQGARVVVISRNEQRCQNTVAEIRGQTGNPHVEYLVADLSSQDQIRKLAAEFHERYPCLDVLVNNAGAFFLARKESVDGIEMTFALDHLSYFLLTILLLDVLKASASARVVNVASAAHRGARIDFNDLQAEHGYGPMRAYGQAKLANILFTYELAHRLADSGVTANALHPGFVASNFAKNNGWVVRVAMRIVHLFAISPEQGAQTSLYLASSPEVEGITGKYFVDCKPVPSSPASYDQDAAKRLWRESERLTGLDGP